MIPFDDHIFQMGWLKQPTDFRFVEIWWTDDLYPDESDTLLGTKTYPPPFGTFEDYFPFAKVENRSFLEGSLESKHLENHEGSGLFQ